MSDTPETTPNQTVIQMSEELFNEKLSLCKTSDLTESLFEANKTERIKCFAQIVSALAPHIPTDVAMGQYGGAAPSGVKQQIDDALKAIHQMRYENYIARGQQFGWR